MSASAPHPSPALALEELLEGRGIVRKAAGGGLLTGLGARLTRASELAPRGGAREALPTGVEALDRLLSGGLPRGGFVEVVARRSSGRFSLAIAALAAATSSGETAAFVDVGGHFDPQSAEEAGVDLERLLWVRPEKLKHAVAAAEMLLATGFALVVVDLGVPPVRGRFVPDAAWVRLERSVRDRGAALLLLSPYRVGATAEAVVSLDAAHPVWRGERRAPPMLSGIGARMTLRKDASAREGARGEMRLSVDPVLEGPPLPAGEGRGEGRSGDHSQAVIPNGARDPSLAGRPPRKGSVVAAAPRDDKEKGSVVAAAPRDDKETGPLEAGVRRDDRTKPHSSEESPLPAGEGRGEGSPAIPSGAKAPFLPNRAARKGSLIAGAPRNGKETAKSHLPRNPSPPKSVLPLGDGMAPFHPPSPRIPGEGGIFFGPAGPPASPPPLPPHAPAQLPLLP